MTNRHGLQGGSVSKEAEPLLRSRSARLTLLLLATVLTAVFLALGTWQVVRLQWKLALIERVEQRVHAAPVVVPAPDQWEQVTADSDEYRRVYVHGRFDYQASALTQATTELGAGYWLLTPLRDEEGNNVFINRGFVTAQVAAYVREKLAIPSIEPQLSEPVTIQGLLRISEPGGGFLRSNDPASDRWHSRDIMAIAEARGLARAAPYFVDADTSNKVLPADPWLQADALPVGGLTVIAFHNNHLVYALTWYALALMTVAVTIWMVRGRKRRLR